MTSVDTDYLFYSWGISFHFMPEEAQDFRLKVNEAVRIVTGKEK